MPTLRNGGRRRGAQEDWISPFMMIYKRKMPYRLTNNRILSIEQRQFMIYLGWVETSREHTGRTWFARGQTFCCVLVQFAKKTVFIVKKTDCGSYNQVKENDHNWYCLSFLQFFSPKSGHYSFGSARFQIMSQLSYSVILQTFSFICQLFSLKYGWNFPLI